MQHLSIAVSPPVFHIFSRFLGGAESPNVELSQYVIFIFLTVLVGQRFLLYHENSCRGRRRGCATDFFWSAGFLFPNQSSCPISGRSVQPLWSAQKAVRLWGSITVLIIIGIAASLARIKDKVALHLALLFFWGKNVQTLAYKLFLQKVVQP